MGRQGGVFTHWFLATHRDGGYFRERITAHLCLKTLFLCVREATHANKGLGSRQSQPWNTQTTAHWGISNSDTYWWSQVIPLDIFTFSMEKKNLYLLNFFYKHNAAKGESFLLRCKTMWRGLLAACSRSCDKEAKELLGIIWSIDLIKHRSTLLPQ